MREIAKDVGLNVSSLYNHFASKEEILNSLYDLYTAYWKTVCPDIHEMLHLAETASLDEVRARLDFRFDPGIEETVNRIFKIAARQISMDPRSERFIKELLLEEVANLLETVLSRMIELDRIEPIDIKTLISLISHFAISASLLNRTSFEVGKHGWHTGLNMLFSLIRPTENAGCQRQSRNRRRQPR